MHRRAAPLARVGEPRSPCSQGWEEGAAPRARALPACPGFGHAPAPWFKLQICSLICAPRARGRTRSPEPRTTRRARDGRDLRQICRRSVSPSLSRAGMPDNCPSRGHLSGRAFSRARGEPTSGQQCPEVLARSLARAGEPSGLPALQGNR